jgi:hypothetical protein
MAQHYVSLLRHLEADLPKHLIKVILQKVNHYIHIADLLTEDLLHHDVVYLPVQETIDLHVVLLLIQSNALYLEAIHLVQKRMGLVEDLQVEAYLLNQKTARLALGQQNNLYREVESLHIADMENLLKMQSVE